MSCNTTNKYIEEYGACQDTPIRFPILPKGSYLCPVTTPFMQMRRKTEVLKHKRNRLYSLETSKKQRYIHINKFITRRNQRLRGWCPIPDTRYYPASASGIYGDDTLLHYDPNVQYIEGHATYL